MISSHPFESNRKLPQEFTDIFKIQSDIGDMTAQQREISWIDSKKIKLKNKRIYEASSKEGSIADNGISLNKEQKQDQNIDTLVIDNSSKSISRINTKQKSIICINALKSPLLTEAKHRRQRSNIYDYSRFIERSKTENEVILIPYKSKRVSDYCRFEKRQFLKLNTIEKQIELKYLPPQKANLQDSHENTQNLSCFIPRIRFSKEMTMKRTKLNNAKSELQSPLISPFVKLKLYQDSDTTMKPNESNKLPLLTEIKRKIKQSIDDAMGKLEDDILNQKCNNTKLICYKNKRIESKRKIDSLNMETTRERDKTTRDQILNKFVNKYLMLSEKFWNEVILPNSFQQIKDYDKSSFCKSVIRWDIFEESILSFIINFVTIDDKKYKNLRLTKLVQQLYRELHHFQTFEDIDQWVSEMIFHPLSKSEVINYYKGPVVRKSDWITFAKDGGLKRVLISSVEKEEYNDTTTSDLNKLERCELNTLSSPKNGVTLNFNKDCLANDKSKLKAENDEIISRFSSILQIEDSLYKYACGSIYKGQRRFGKREGFGKFSLCSYGLTYEGYWENGLQHGEGTLKLSTSQINNVNPGKLTGQWKNGFISGTCKIKWDDQSEFNGQFELNTYIFGTFTWNDENDILRKYFGLFKSSKMVKEDNVKLTKRFKLGNHNILSRQQEKYL